MQRSIHDLADSGDALAELASSLEGHRRGFLDVPFPDARQRRANLARLEAVLRSRTDDIVAAIQDDFGFRSPYETLLLEVFTTLKAIRHARRRTRAWMRARRHPVLWALLPATARTVYQPLGVVGIISPWNYPLYLSLSPLAAALAAGNRVMLKPSELTPRFSALLADMMGEAFPDGTVTVHPGGPEVAQAFSRLHFDHILFTGSTNVGRLVHRAAAEHLVPVTLELGGKSPTVVDRGVNLATTAETIATGKLTNAGQTCIAPDYVFVHEDDRARLVDELSAAAARLYPTLGENADYSSIVSDRHHARLTSMCEEVANAGGRVISVNPGSEPSEALRRKFPLTMLLDAPVETLAMREEIFGPVLPIVTYRDHTEVIEQINAGDRPLALYVFSGDGAVRDRYRDETRSGSIVFNATLVQMGVEELPFGGIGASGMGRYHGESGFQTFSHARAVYRQFRPNGIHLVSRPPFNGLGRWVLDKLLIGGR